MRSFVRVLVVLGLVWLLTPGLAEAMENAWHLLTAGHGAHQPEAGDEHAPAGDEHGCTGTFHLCNCCPSLLSPVGKVPAGARDRQPPTQVPGLRSPTHRDLALPGPYHPPRV